MRGRQEGWQQGERGKEGRVTFDVPRPPYSIAEPDLVVLHHVKVLEVLPLGLDQHTAAGWCVGEQKKSNKRTRINLEPGQRTYVYTTANRNTLGVILPLLLERKATSLHLHSMVRLSNSLARVASTARDWLPRTPKLKRTRRVCSNDVEKS